MASLAGAHEASRTRSVPPLLRFVLGRIGASAVMLLVLVVVAFLIVRLIPGDPAQYMAGADATPETIDALRRRFGLDRPLWEQFVSFVGAALTGDLGASLQNGQPVAELIAQRLPATLQLTVAALLLAVALGLALGMAAAYLTEGGRRPRFEQTFVGLTGAAGVIPEIAIGAVLVSLLAVQAGLFPASGYGSVAFLILPALTVGLRPAFNIARIVRVEVLEVLQQQFIVTGRSKRLSEWRIGLVHALPNIMTPLLTLSGLLFAYLIGGVVVVENLFAWPGLGASLVGAVINRDYPVIQGIILAMGVLIVVVNLVIDVVLGLIDPRIALQEGSR